MDLLTTGVALALFVFLLWAVLREPRDDTAREPLLQTVRSNFTKLDPGFAEIPLRAGTSAYTDDKTSITLCLTDPETGRAYDTNTIMYVALHELAHVVSTKVGHGEEFRRNFARLLDDAAQHGFYDPKRPIPQTYCGVEG